MQYKIIVDKQSRTNPSTEKKEYIIDIEELRVKGDIYDSLIITKEEDYVMRRLKLSKYHVLSVLEEPIKQPIPDLNIELFEGDNYIYLLDMAGNKFYAEYLVKNDFTDTYVTRNEMNSSINQTAQQIDLTVNQKLTGYSTTEEMNSAINLKVGEITSTVSSTYATKGELNTAKSEIKQTTDSITSTVSKKVGKNEVISSVNQSAESVTINASKVNLNGYVTATNLQTAGKTVINGSNITTGTIDASKANITNINADNIKSGTITGRTISGGTITGTQISNGSNFKVDSNGNLTCNNANITGGDITLYATNFKSAFRVKNTNDHSKQVEIADQCINIYRGTSDVRVGIGINSDGGYISIGNTWIGENSISSPKLTQTSLKSKKKNIKKLKVNALDLIKNSDICLYNLKSEKAGSKKHIGLVIGEGYNCPSEVISEDGQGVEQYSMTSLAWKAIQELIEENQNLKQRIEKLEAK